MGRMTSSPSPSDLPTAASLIPPHLRALDTLAVTASGAEIARPMPLALTASASRLTSKTIGGLAAGKGPATDWQADAWDMYDLIGEQRFLANTLAGRGAQARLFVGTLNRTEPLADPEPTLDPKLSAMLDDFGKSAPGRAQIMLRALIGYFVGGETYLVGIPDYLIVAAETGEEPVRPVGATAGDIDMSSLVWRALSANEIVFKRGGSVDLRLAESNGRKVEADINELYVMRSWRPHPNKAWEPDSPTRSSLPVLRELTALTMAVGSMTDSRLAGAGVLLVPDSARKAMLRAQDLPEDSADDPLTDALIEAMSTAIADRSSAAAYVPLIVTVPDDTVDKFKHLTFESPFDSAMPPLREEAIRRLALGQDAPPELLLGTGGMNHWGAWLVREDVVTTHIEPPLALFCDTITTHYLRPLMLASGYSQEEVDDTVVWYDVSHMIVRPNRGAEAEGIYKLGELSGEALRAANGFDENDAPPADTSDPAISLAFDMVGKAPSLAQNPGLVVLVDQIRQIMNGAPPAPVEPGDAQPQEPVEAAPADETPTTDDGTSVPTTDSAPADPAPITASAAEVRSKRSGAAGGLGKAFLDQAIAKSEAHETEEASA